MPNQAACDKPTWRANKIGAKGKSFPSAAVAAMPKSRAGRSSKMDEAQYGA